MWVEQCCLLLQVPLVVPINSNKLFGCNWEFEFGVAQYCSGLGYAPSLRAPSLPRSLTYGTPTMTRFAVRGAVCRAIWCLQCRGLRFAVPPRFAVRGLGAYNESGAANRKPPAARRKTPLCLQYRDLRRGTRLRAAFWK